MNFYSLPSSIITILWPFSVLFSKSSWFTALDLLLGALLCRGDRTVTRILRTTGLSQNKGFSKYHRILNSLDWSLKCASEILIKMLLKIVGKDRPVILIDETLERRKEKKFVQKIIIEMLFALHAHRPLTQQG